MNPEFLQLHPIHTAIKQRELKALESRHAIAIKNGAPLAALAIALRAEGLRHTDFDGRGCA